MAAAAYGDGFKSFDEGAGQAPIRGMSNYLAVFLQAANDAVFKEPAHVSMTIIEAASRQMVRVARDRFRCWRLSGLIHTQFHKV